MLYRILKRMIERVVKEFPNFRAVATTLRSVKTASLGLVRGRPAGGGATTPTACLASTNAPTWRQAGRYFVLPVPEGAEAVAVAGEQVDTGLGGAAGWLALGPYRGGTTVPVSAADASCNIFVCATGLVVSFK